MCVNVTGNNNCNGLNMQFANIKTLKGIVEFINKKEKQMNVVRLYCTIMLLTSTHYKLSPPTFSSH